MLGFEINRTTINNLFQVGSFSISKKLKKATPISLDGFEINVQGKIMQRLEEKRLAVDEETYLLKTELDERLRNTIPQEIDSIIEKAERMLIESKLKLDMLLKEHGLNSSIATNSNQQ